MKKLEYTFVDVTGAYEGGVVVLNGLGAQGWEICASAIVNGKTYIYLKREILN